MPSCLGADRAVDLPSPQAERRQSDIIKGNANYSGVLGDSEVIVSVVLAALWLTAVPYPACHDGVYHRRRYKWMMRACCGEKPPGRCHRQALTSLALSTSPGY